MPDKPKVAFYWCASCGGCEESIVDLAEDILGVVAAVDIMFWPVAMDFKKSDVETIADGGLLVAMINGAVRTSEQEEMAKLLRRKSTLVVAYGSCAHMGGIPGLANQFDREQIMKYVYEDSPSTVNADHARPVPATGNGGPTLPAFRSMVRALDQVIDVDYYLPGCPPVPRMLKAAIGTLLSGKLPPKGTVLGPDTGLCEECPRKETKPADLSYTAFHRPHEVTIKEEKCLLAQGVVCMGPATRGGCGAQCIAGNMPCTGCFGPTSRVRDQGAKILSAIASSVAAKDTEGIDRTLATIPDPVGTFYRYGLPGSLLRRKIADHN
ncbi:MAG TPA: oxidoreductase [Bacteroidota bacterium]|nr:oxidoreductase [Bacteroidota bacterium]